ncbi:MAG: PDZ domain-containing protein [Acidobacteriota bacterium]
MSQNPQMPLDSGFDPTVTNCQNCHTPMPRELRFCRNCGFRLGEGTAEYTETVRFQNGGPQVLTGNSAAAGQNPFAPNYAGPLTTAGGRAVGKRQKRMSGMSWMFIGLLVFFIVAAVFTAVVTPIRRNVTSISIPSAPKAYVGVSSFDTGEGGVTFDNVEPPGSPADKAGLVGGDIITSFDGHVVTTDDQITELLTQTPIGKTVDVIYIRDGEVKTTKLVPIAKEEFDRLVREFRNRPEGKGRFGFDDGDTERVPVPGTKLFGVRLDDVSPSLPADMAGIKVRDVVVEFGGAPIRTPEELSSRVKRAIPYSTVKVVVARGTELIDIPVKMGKQ